MLDREHKQLEKIKFKQQQEIQQMIDYEMSMQKIREENDQRIKKEKQKEEKHMRELEKRRQEIEKERKKKEEDKKRKEEM